jgi:hypothetical protein
VLVKFVYIFFITNFNIFFKEYLHDILIYLIKISFNVAGARSRKKAILSGISAISTGICHFIRAIWWILFLGEDECFILIIFSTCW